jgi:two-component system LytT family response regulator
MKLKTVLIDDEEKIREVLAIKIKKHCPNVEVISKVGNVPDAYKVITEQKPDLIFLDIQMPGESGFDLLSKFEKINFQIIFATGYNEYALDALKVSAVDYLLKPIRNSDLVEAVAKASERVSTTEKLKDYELLKHNLNNIGSQKTRVAIPNSGSYQFVEVEKIIRCEGWQRYTKIHLMDGKVIVSSYNIGVYKDMLASYGFYSCHKSHLINQTHIVKYESDNTVLLSDNSSVPVSRRKKEEFFEKFIKNI